MICDEEVTEIGGALFAALNVDDECSPEVTFIHAAGCHKVEVKEGKNTTKH